MKIKFSKFLDALLKNPDERQIIEWSLQIARALKYMHSLPEFKMIHRDIKTENMALNKEGILKLIDFGFSRKVTTIKMASTDNIGSPIYMAPEVFIPNCGYSEKCDNYSWALTFWRCLTNRVPFGEFRTRPELNAAKQDPKRTLSDIPKKSELSPVMNQIIQDCLRFDAKERPTMIQIVARLEDLLKDQN